MDKTIESIARNVLGLDVVVQRVKGASAQLPLGTVAAQSNKHKQERQ